MVHGGDLVTQHCLITDEVIEKLAQCSKLAPLHNPLNIFGINLARKLFKCRQFAILDTAFHTDMPKFARNEAICSETADKHQIKHYGFHGINQHNVNSNQQVAFCRSR